MKNEKASVEGSEMENNDMKRESGSVDGQERESCLDESQINLDSLDQPCKNNTATNRKQNNSLCFFLPLCN